uniref:Uncharacterized protein n=1 Tax=Romanomermis culicivorax TaxID=13658 RepID=A0A915IV09_ROMCU
MNNNEKRGHTLAALNANYREPCSGSGFYLPTGAEANKICSTRNCTFGRDDCWRSKKYCACRPHRFGTDENYIVKHFCCADDTLCDLVPGCNPPGRDGHFTFHKRLLRRN